MEREKFPPSLLVPSNIVSLCSEVLRCHLAGRPSVGTAAARGRGMDTGNLCRLRLRRRVVSGSLSPGRRRSGPKVSWLFLSTDVDTSFGPPADDSGTKAHRTFLEVVLGICG